MILAIGYKTFQLANVEYFFTRIFDLIAFLCLYEEMRESINQNG